MSARVFMDPDGAGNTREPTAADVLFLARGDQVGCEAGHVCWTSSRGIYRRQIITCEDMAPAPFQTTPRPSRRMGTCICGRIYVKALLEAGDDPGTVRSGAVLALHIVGEGWRDVPRG